MKSFVFPYSISFGKRDNTDGEIVHSLSDKDAKRIVRSAEEGGRSLLSEDPFINDINAKVCKAVNKALIEQLIQNSQPVWDFLGADKWADPKKPAGKKRIQEYLDNFNINVYYPEELQLLKDILPKDNKGARYEIMTEEEAQEFIKKDNNNNNVIILTDEGKTLYYVPLKFSGTVIIPAEVRKIRSGYYNGNPSTRAFHYREKITEIIIEDGLSEIEADTFNCCRNLKKITIPSSVKKIGHCAFTGCSALEEVALPEGLEEIDYSSFNCCHSLKTLFVPSSLKTMYKLQIRDIYIYGKTTSIIEKLGCDWACTTLHVISGSEAEKYAVSNGIQYEIIRERSEN